VSADNFFQTLRSYWIPLPPGIQESFLGQTKEFIEIENRLKEDPLLASYDQQIYPELHTILGMTISDESPPPRAVLHFCNNQLQLMENVFLALKLAQYHAHPLNRGWMNLFRRWTASPTMRLLWPSLKSRYSRDFVAFAEYQLNLSGMPPVIKKESVAPSRIRELFGFSDPPKAAGFTPFQGLYERLFGELSQEWPMQKKKHKKAEEEVSPAATQESAQETVPSLGAEEKTQETASSPAAMERATEKADKTEQESMQETAQKKQMEGAKEKPGETAQEVYAQYFEPFLHATEIKMWTISHPLHMEETWGIALLGPHPMDEKWLKSLRKEKRWPEYLPKGIELQRLMVWIRPAFRGVGLGTQLLNAVLDGLDSQQRLGLIVVLPPLRRDKPGYGDEMAGWLRFYGQRGFVRVTAREDQQQILTGRLDPAAFCLVMPALLEIVHKCGRGSGTPSP